MRDSCKTIGSGCITGHVAESIDRSTLSSGRSVSKTLSGTCTVAPPEPSCLAPSWLSNREQAGQGGEGTFSRRYVIGCDAVHPDRRGGQHVAMRCTGVLAIDGDIGVLVASERSQHGNRDKADALLDQILEVARRGGN